MGMNPAIITNARSEGNIGIGLAVPINTVRELLPQLRVGKITRGRIGVSVLPVPREAFEDFGLKDRKGALVAQVPAGGPAAKAGIEPGDVITEYNGRPIATQDELVKMVIATKPGTSVPIKILRNRQEKTMHVTVEELDLEAEQQQTRGGRGNNDRGDHQTDQHEPAGFDLTPDNLTPRLARWLRSWTSRSTIPSSATTPARTSDLAARAIFLPASMSVRCSASSSKSSSPRSRASSKQPQRSLRTPRESITTQRALRAPRLHST